MISYFLQSMTSFSIFIFLRPYKWRLLLLIIIVIQNENGCHSVFHKNKAQSLSYDRKDYN